MRRFLILPLLLLFLLSGAISTLGAEEAPPPVNPPAIETPDSTARGIAVAQYLPADTMALITISKIKTITEAIPASSLGQLLGQKSVRAFMQEIQVSPDAVAKYDTVMKEVSDFIYNPAFRQLFGDNLNLALLPMDMDAVADTPEAAYKYLLAISSVSAPVTAETFGALIKGKVTVRPVEFGGLNMLKLSIAKKNNRNITAYAFIDGAGVLMALAPEPIQAAMAHKKQAGPGLATAKEFVEAERFWAGYQGESTYAQTFVNIERMIAAFLQTKNPAVKEVLEDPEMKLGLLMEAYKGVKSFFTVVYTDGPSLESVCVLTFNEAELQGGMKKAFTVKAGNNPYLYLLQRQPLLYVWSGSLNLDYLLESIAMDFNTKEDPKAFERGMLEVLGLTPDELIKSIGSQCGFMLDTIVNDGLFPIPKISLWLEIRDKAALEKAIAHIRKVIVTEGGPDAVEVKEGKTSFLSWPLLPGDAGQPAVAIHGKTLYVTSSTRSMKNILDNTVDPNKMPAETVARIGQDLSQKIASANSASGIAYPGLIAEPLLGVIDFVNNFSSNGSLPTTTIKRELALFLNSIDYTAAYCNLESGRAVCTYTLKWTEAKAAQQ